MKLNKVIIAPTASSRSIVHTHYEPPIERISHMWQVVCFPQLKNYLHRVLSLAIIHPDALSMPENFSIQKID